MTKLGERAGKANETVGRLQSLIKAFHKHSLTQAGDCKAGPQTGYTQVHQDRTRTSYADSRGKAESSGGRGSGVTNHVEGEANAEARIDEVMQHISVIDDRWDTVDERITDISNTIMRLMGEAQSNHTFTRDTATQVASLTEKLDYETRVRATRIDELRTQVDDTSRAQNRARVELDGNVTEVQTELMRLRGEMIRIVDV